MVATVVVVVVEVVVVTVVLVVLVDVEPVAVVVVGSAATVLVDCMVSVDILVFPVVCGGSVGGYSVVILHKPSMFLKPNTQSSSESIPEQLTN